MKNKRKGRLGANRKRIYFITKKKLHNNTILNYLLNKILKIAIVLSLFFILLIINNINPRDVIRFIICYFGANKIGSKHLVRKYFQALDKFVPYANIIFAVSKYTKIDPIVLRHQNITINIERFGTKTKLDLLKKYPYYSFRFYYKAVRYVFYSQYLKKHSEIKYAIISDVDTLFFQDPFLLINKDPNVVHLMEDIYPFRITKDGNYIWANAWNKLDKKIKKKCGFKKLNIALLSDENKNKIPLNSGLLIGKTKNIIKIVDLISTRWTCPGIFKNNAEQGLLNYLDLSDELKELNISIKRHNIYKDSLISCPELLPIKKYIQRINSSYFIGLHHYTHLKKYYIKSSPKKFLPFF